MGHTLDTTCNEGRVASVDTPGARAERAIAAIELRAAADLLELSLDGSRDYEVALRVSDARFRLGRLNAAAETLLNDRAL